MERKAHERKEYVGKASRNVERKRKWQVTKNKRTLQYECYFISCDHERANDDNSRFSF